MEKYKRELKLLVRVAAESHGYYISKYGSDESGYGRGSVEYRDRRISPYFGEVEEGGFVIDASNLEDHPDLVKWVVCGPMCSPLLKNEEIDKLSDKDRESASSMIPGLAGEFLGLAIIAQNRKFRGLDEVSPKMYAAIWAEHGAKVGVRKGDYIEWANGEKSSIPDAENRYKDAW